MDKQKYAKTLEKGDLILVAYNNYLSHAIYAGDGGRGNPQFYYLAGDLSWQRGRIRDGKKPYKGYIIRPGDRVVAKLSPDELGDEDLAVYEEFKELLTQNGYL